MKIKKHISKLLLVGILINNLSFISNAGTLSPDTRYETFEGNSIRVDDILEEDRVDVEIEGNTLVNLAPAMKKENFIFNGGSINNGVYTSNESIPWSGIHQREGVKLFKPNTTYTVSYKVDGAFNASRYIYSGFNNLWRANKEIPVSNNTFTTPSNVTEVCIGLYYSSPRGRTVEISEIQVEEASQKTNFKEFNQDKKNIRLLEPLRGIKDGARDRIIKKDGQWVIERNCREIILDGSEDWVCRHDKVNNENPIFEIVLNKLDSHQINVISDKFKGYPANYTWLNDEEAISLNQNGHLQIRINRSKLKSIDAEGFKEWIRDNRVTVVYKLITPIYEPLKANLNIPLYLETTHISNNSTVPANMRVTVDRAANRAKEFSEIAKLNPTTQNLSQARYWINLMRESTLKDSFQEALNDVAEIVDITIDKKSVSGNADIYIKSKNSLSLSLDTNNVLFEDFDGVENMEKTNAINLTVSSSLPYVIKAYLEDEIQNSDKSSVIDKSVLNIKANSDTVYKSFIDTTSPIILLDDQPEGSYNSHGVDIRLNGGLTHKADVYKTTIKFEVEQK